MRAAAGFPVLGAAGALLIVALFFGEGSSDGRLFWIGALRRARGARADGGHVHRSRAGAVTDPCRGWRPSGCSPAFVLWNGATMGWSIAPDRSWAYLDRGLVYLAFAVLGLYVGAVRAATGGGDRRPDRCAARRRVRMGAAREGCAGPCSGRRTRGAAARSGGLLERARAPCGGCTSVRALARRRAYPSTVAARRRRALALHRRDRPRAHVLARRDHRRDARRLPLARALRRPVRGGRNARRRQRSRRRRRRVGVDPGRARR